MRPASPAPAQRLEPFRPRLRTYLRWALPLTVVFAVVYGGINGWTARRESVLHLYADWELGIPHLPEAVLAYLSIQLLFLVPLWTLSAARIAGLGRTMLAAILIGGLVFVLLPTELGHARSAPQGWLGPVYAAIHLLDPPHNLFPSLHVALGTLVVLFVAQDARPALRVAYLLWWLLLCVSVLLTHQHHLLDVAGGLALALACNALRGGDVSPSPHPTAREPCRPSRS